MHYSDSRLSDPHVALQADQAAHWPARQWTGHRLVWQGRCSSCWPLHPLPLSRLLRTARPSPPQLTEQLLQPLQPAQPQFSFCVALPKASSDARTSGSGKVGTGSVCWLGAESHWTVTTVLGCTIRPRLQLSSLTASRLPHTVSSRLYCNTTFC